MLIKNNKRLFWLSALLFLIIALSACGGQAEEVALSEQAPPRRGSVDTLTEVQEITAEILDVSVSDEIERLKSASTDDPESSLSE